MREIRIPLYGIIQLDDLEWEVVNSRPFQRLRRIKQLAFSDYVYPGAVHTRFEHSLGVMHLVTQAFDRMHEKREVREMLGSQNGFDYGPDTWAFIRRLLRLAALTHDWGHMSFSHAGESVMPPNPKKPKKSKDGSVIGHEAFEHEDYSFALIRMELDSILKHHNLNDLQIKADEVADFIQGRTSNVRLTKAAPWRGLIKSELDCDRMDYLQRDSMHLGVQYGRFDVDRVLSTLTMTDQSEDSRPRLAIEEGGLLSAESLILARYYMFVQVYFHKVRRFLDKQYAELLKEVFEKKPLLPPVDDSGKPNVKALERYLELDDWYIQSEIVTRAKKSAPASALLNRECWKVVRDVSREVKPDEADAVRAALEALDIDFYLDLTSDKGVQKFKASNILVAGDKPHAWVRPILSVSKVASSIPEVIHLGRIYVPVARRDEASQALGSLLRDMPKRTRTKKK